MQGLGKGGALSLVPVFQATAEEVQRLFVAPHTPNPWGHVELVSKDAGIG